MQNQKKFVKQLLPPKEVEFDYDMRGEMKVGFEVMYNNWGKDWKYKTPQRHEKFSPIFTCFACLKRSVVLQSGQRRRISLGVGIREGSWPQKRVALVSGSLEYAEKGVTVEPSMFLPDFIGELTVVVFNNGEHPFTIIPRQAVITLVFTPSTEPLGVYYLVGGNPRELPAPEHELFVKPEEVSEVNICSYVFFEFVEILFRFIRYKNIYMICFPGCKRKTSSSLSSFAS